MAICAFRAKQQPGAGAYTSRSGSGAAAGHLRSVSDGQPGGEPILFGVRGEPGARGENVPFVRDGESAGAGILRTVWDAPDTCGC